MEPSQIWIAQTEALLCHQSLLEGNKSLAGADEIIQNLHPREEAGKMATT